MKQKCEIWLVINGDGDYTVGVDRGEAIDNFDNQIGNAAGSRVIKITASVGLPLDTETEIDVPDEAGETVETEAA